MITPQSAIILWRSVIGSLPKTTSWNNWLIVLVSHPYTNSIHLPKFKSSYPKITDGRNEDEWLSFWDPLYLTWFFSHIPVFSNAQKHGDAVIKTVVGIWWYRAVYYPVTVDLGIISIDSMKYASRGAPYFKRRSQHRTPQKIAANSPTESPKFCHKTRRN